VGANTASAANNQEECEVFDPHTLPAKIVRSFDSLRVT